MATRQPSPGPPIMFPAGTRARWRADGCELLVDDDVEHGRELVSAIVLGPAQAEEPGTVEGGMPLGLPGPVVIVGRRRGQAGIVLRQPCPQPGPEVGLRRGVTKVHR